MPAKIRPKILIAPLGPPQKSAGITAMRKLVIKNHPLGVKELVEIAEGKNQAQSNTCEAARCHRTSTRATMYA